MKEIILVIMLMILIFLGIPYFVTLIFAPFYFKFGFGKRFYHNVMGWHMPVETEENTFDGCSAHNHCKFCGKEIMQDSQGNWF